MDPWSLITENMEYKKTILFIITAILYVLSFITLAKNKYEYIGYLVVFLLNIIFPFIWVKDYRGFVQNNFGTIYQFIMPWKQVPKENLLVQYGFISMIIVLLFQLLSSFLVLLKNEGVRKMKLKNKDNTKRPKDGLNTDSKQTENNDRLILQTFISTVVLMYAYLSKMVSAPLQSEKNTEIEKYEYVFIKDEFLKSDKNTHLIATLRWFFSQPHSIIHYLDTHWRENMENTNIHPILRILILYGVSFVVSFFGLFFRTTNSSSQYNIINVNSPFTQHFEQNIGLYRFISVIFLGGLASLFLVGCVYFMNRLTHIPRYILQGVTCLGLISIFATFIGMKNALLPTNMSVKVVFFSIFVLLLSLVGTPVILMVMQLFAESGLLKRVLPFNTLNSGNTLWVLSGTISLLIWLIVFTLGVKNDWLANENAKPFRLFIAIFICMILSLLVGLSTYYPIGILVYTHSTRAITKFLTFAAPLFMLILSGYHTLLSYKNFNTYKQFL